MIGWLVLVSHSQEHNTQDLKQKVDQISPSAGKQVGHESVGGMFSDATLTIMSAKNNPIVEARFQDVYPVALKWSCI